MWTQSLLSPLERALTPMHQTLGSVRPIHQGTFRTRLVATLLLWLTVGDGTGGRRPDSRKNGVSQIRPGLRSTRALRTTRQSCGDFPSCPNRTLEGFGYEVLAHVQTNDREEILHRASDPETS